MQRTVTINGAAIVVDPTGYEGYWQGVEAGRWEPETFGALDRILRRDWRMVDVGAWIGPLTLYSALKCARVDAFECDPVAIRVLRANLRENPIAQSKVALHEFALGCDDSFATLYTRVLGNSESSTLRRHERGGEVIECGESFMCGVRDILGVFRQAGYAFDASSFVKIDVEGAEFALVERLRPIIANSRCVWCVSVHELNINPTHLPAPAIRAMEVVRLLESFSALDWFDMHLDPLDKAAVVQSVVAGTWPIHQSFIFRHSGSGAFG